MSANHASGPWMAEKHPQGHYGIFQRDYAHQVAEVFDRNTSPEMAEANARLIAAAPELLEALENCRLLIEGTAELNGLPFEGDGTFARTIQEARAAIAKATGKEDA